MPASVLAAKPRVARICAGARTSEKRDCPDFNVVLLKLDWYCGKLDKSEHLKFNPINFLKIF